MKYVQSLPRLKLDATSAPTSTDDTSGGWSIGSIWVTSDSIFRCTDATLNAAVWVYVGENPANKVNDITLDPTSTVKYPSNKAVFDYFKYAYADSSWKAPVYVATTAPLPANTAVGITLVASANGTFPGSLDSVGPITVNTEILVANEANQAHNGIYVLTNAGSVSTPWVLTRRFDAATGARMNGAVVYVTSGTTKGTHIFKQITTAVTIGTTLIVWQDIDTVGGGGGGSFASITGSPTDNAPLAALFAATLPQTSTLTSDGTARTYAVPHTWNNPSKLKGVTEASTGYELNGMIYQNGADQDYISFPGDIPASDYQFKVTTYAQKL